MLTDSLKQIAMNIDSRATQILFQCGEEALLTSMHLFMGDIKLLLDELRREELDALCEHYSGFYQCMKGLETLAKGVSEGSIPLMPSKETKQQLNRVRQNDYDLNQALVARYDNIRKTLRDLNTKLMVGLSREGIERCAKRLEIAGHGNALHLNTEHEMNVFFDFCLYQYVHNDSNAIQKSFNQFAGVNSEQVSIFEAAAKGYFAYLQILESVDDAGLVVFDLERQTEHLMIDRGLNAAAKKPGHYTIVTHVIRFNDFIMTTGASTPVNIDTDDGAKVQQRFEQFMKQLTSGSIELKDRRQVVTDLYKICLHEDITGTVASPTLPFGEGNINTRRH